VVLFILYIVQTSLPAFRDDYPAIAALHPVLAIGIFVAVPSRASCVAEVAIRRPRT
jgi:hypothetical protein